MASIRYEAGSVVSLMTTELNSLANNGRAIATSAYANNTNLYLFGFFELFVDYGTAPTAGSLVELYLIPTVDGTNYADASSAIDPPYTTYAGSFPVRAITTDQRITLGGPGMPALVPLPPVAFKAFIYNKTGQSFSSSANTLKMIPYRYQTT